MADELEKELVEETPVVEEKPLGLNIGSVSTGGGDFVAGSQHKGDVVEGDKNVDESQGKVVIEGDMTGGEITSYNTKVDTDPVKELFTPLLEAAEGEVWPNNIDKNFKDEYDTPQVLLGAAMAQAEIEVSETQPPFTPEEYTEQTEGWTEKFKKLAPKLLKGGLTVGEAVVGTFVSKSPVVAGLMAGIEFFKGEV